jgi:hypothetical protein
LEAKRENTKIIKYIQKTRIFKNILTNYKNMRKNVIYHKINILHLWNFKIIPKPFIISLNEI